MEEYKIKVDKRSDYVEKINVLPLKSKTNDSFKCFPIRKPEFGRNFN